MLGICSLNVLVLHKTLLVPVFMYGSKTMLKKENERSRISAVQMESLRRLLGIMRMDRVLKAQIMELCKVKWGLNERIDEGMLQWFREVEGMENDKIAKKVYVEVCR